MKGRRPVISVLLIVLLLLLAAALTGGDLRSLPGVCFNTVREMARFFAGIFRLT
jgi:hypothetical protein